MSMILINLIPLAALNRISNRIITFLVIFVFILKGVVMGDKLLSEANEFKKKISFNEAYNTVDNSKAVVFAKFNLEKLNSVQKFKSKNPISDEVNLRNNGILKEMIFATGQDTLYIEIFISNTNHELAMERLLNQVIFTTFPKILYEKCPYNLGDLNISIINNDSFHIKWTYFNVYFEVNYMGTEVDVEQFCRELQQYTEDFVVNNINQYRPQFKEVIISSDHIKKGDTVSIKIIPSYGEAFTGQKKNSHVNISLEKIWSAEKLDLIDYTDFSFKFKGIAEGTETITFILADLDALTCAKHEVTITVSE